MMHLSLTRQQKYLLIGILLTSPITLPIASVILPPFVGYYTDSRDATEAAIKHRDPDECNKYLQLFSILSPPQSEMRHGCIFETAQALKDPRACLLLMPSSYGISCIGDVWGKVSEFTTCFDRRSIPELEDGELRCFKYDDDVTKKLAFQTKDCANISLPILQDECNTMLGAHYGDTKYCDKIENPILKSVCEVRIELQKKYPEIPELR